ELPIATCEAQGFAYAAKLHFSEVLWWLGEKETAGQLYREAQELKQRFNEAFWLADVGFFAMRLDGRKRPIRSIGSDPGHCLATRATPITRSRRSIRGRTRRRRGRRPRWCACSRPSSGSTRTPRSTYCSSIRICRRGCPR